MAIQGSVTLNEILILEIDADPTVTATVAPLGSFASMDNGSGMYVKTGAGDTAWTKLSTSTGGGVTSVATGTGLTGGPITSTGTISLATITNNTILANISGSTAAPTPNTLTAIIDTISSTQGSILYRNATSWVALAPGTSGQFLKTQGAAANPIWSAESFLGTVTSVGMTVPSFLSVTPSTITTSGTFAISLATETANTIFAGPTTGAAAVPTFRTQVLADLPQLTNGQLYIGSTDSSVVAATLTAGTNMSAFTNAAGSITVNAANQVGTGLKIKAGTVAAGSFTSNPKTFAVTFSTAFASAAYTIVITGTDARSFTWSSKATTGFTISANANAALTGNVDWQCIATGESN